MTRILGIVNVTRDSFSDGGAFLDPRAAIEHARRLLADGADIIDVGAESTHPDAEDVPAKVEIERLTPVVTVLKAEGALVSVDTRKAAVMGPMLELGVDVINDVNGFRDPEAVAAVRGSSAKLVVMHSRSTDGRADRRASGGAELVDSIVTFFERRMSELESAGVARERIILDPGMGFFLGSDANASLAVLRELRRIIALGPPVLVSTSRKSFIGALLGDGAAPRPATERAAGTLATELWAVEQGAAYVRTHDVRQLRDALRMLEAIGAPPQVGAPPYAV